MKFITAAIIATLAFIGGQENLKRAYDPETLEKNALAMNEAAYRHGCILAVVRMSKKQIQNSRLQDCASFAKKDRKNSEEIFHNKIWKRHD